jgi:hypothetical protein
LESFGVSSSIFNKNNQEIVVNITNNVDITDFAQKYLTNTNLSTQPNSMKAKIGKLVSFLFTNRTSLEVPKFSPFIAKLYTELMKLSGLPSGNRNSWKLVYQIAQLVNQVEKYETSTGSTKQ